MDANAADEVGLDLEVACIVGILPRERVEPQRIRVRVAMALDLGPVGDTGDLAAGVDYAVVDGLVRFLAIEGRFRLIESLGIAALRAILATPVQGEGRAAVRQASIRITKPTVLRAAEASVAMTRDAAWAHVPAVQRGAAAVMRLLDVPEVRIARIFGGDGPEPTDGAAFAVADGVWITARRT